MQIQHFDWLRYWRSISNSYRVAKFASVSLFCFVFCLRFSIVFDPRETKLGFPFFFQPFLASKGYYHIWSLISNEGDALLEIANLMGENDPKFRCTGMYDERASKYFSMCYKNPCQTRRFRNGAMRFLRP